MPYLSGLSDIYTLKTSQPFVACTVAVHYIEVNVKIQIIKIVESS
jgi:hypothetical protein